MNTQPYYDLIIWLVKKFILLIVIQSLTIWLCIHHTEHLIPTWVELPKPEEQIDEKIIELPKLQILVDSSSFTEIQKIIT